MPHLHPPTTPRPHLNYTSTTPQPRQKSLPTDEGNETQVAETLQKPPQDARNHYPPMGAMKPPPFLISPSTILETQSTPQIHLTRRDFLGSGPIRVRYSLDQTHSRTQCIYIYIHKQFTRPAHTYLFFFRTRAGT